MLATPLNGLGNVSAGGDGAEWCVNVGTADVAAWSEDFANVLRQIPAVSVPCAVFLDG